MVRDIGWADRQQPQSIMTVRQRLVITNNRWAKTDDQSRHQTHISKSDGEVVADVARLQVIAPMVP